MRFYIHFKRLSDIKKRRFRETCLYKILFQYIVYTYVDTRLCKLYVTDHKNDGKSSKPAM